MSLHFGLFKQLAEVLIAWIANVTHAWRLQAPSVFAYGHITTGQRKVLLGQVIATVDSLYRLLQNSSALYSSH